MSRPRMPPAYTISVRLAGQLFEIAVPNPGNVAPVGLVVVDEERYHLLAWRLGDDLQVLIEARWGSSPGSEARGRPSMVSVLQAPVLRVEQRRPPSGAPRSCNARSSCDARPRRHHVVHHVGAAERALTSMPFDAGIARCRLLRPKT